MIYLVQGLLQGSAYALVAMGLVLVYCVVKAFQFAHGAVVMYASYAFLLSYGWSGQSVPAALAFTVVTTTLLSVALSWLVFEPLLGRHFPSLVASLGIATVIHQLIAIYAFHGEAVAYPRELKLSGAVEVLGIPLDYNRILIFVVAVLSIVLLDLFFRRTRPGIEMRAIADSPDGAQITGIGLIWTIRTAFVLAGVAAAIVGILIGLLFSTINPEIGDTIAIKGMAAALLGGATNMRGAMAAGFLIGVSESLAVGYVSSTFSPAIAYLCILAVLLLRPQGLFGRSEVARA